MCIIAKHRLRIVFIRRISKQGSYYSKMATLFDFGFISTPDGCLRLQSLFFATFVKSKRQKYFPPVLLFFSVVLKACDYIRRLLPGTHAFLSINIAYCMCSTSILADIEVSFGCHSFISVKKMQKENGNFFQDCSTSISIDF